MNCFNIRELQGILKRRFFTDLVNSTEHNHLLASSVLGLRYKLNSSNTTTPDYALFYNFGTNLLSHRKNYSVTNILDSGKNQISFGSILPDTTVFSFFIKLDSNTGTSVLSCFSVLNYPTASLFALSLPVIPT
jgi:hypothetical protein